MVQRPFGQRGLLPAGSLVIGAADAFLGLFRTSLLQAFITMGVLGVGIGSTFAAIPGLIVRAVPGAETGKAAAANAVELPSNSVRMAVEVVSPSSTSADRAKKPRCMSPISRKGVV